MADSRIPVLPDNIDTTGFYFICDSGAASSAQRLPVSFVTGITDTLALSISENASAIGDNTAAIVINAEAIADVPVQRGELVYSARVNGNGGINVRTFKNKTFLSTWSLGTDFFQVNFVTPILNWENNLEIQATNNQTASPTSSNRNPHIYANPDAPQNGIRVKLLDSSGNAQTNSAFWIRIYKWA